MAVHEIHIIKGTCEKFEEYKKIFDGSSLLRHYGDHIYEWMEQGLSENNVYIAEDGNGEAIAWGCDLTYEYVKINAEYRS